MSVAGTRATLARLPISTARHRNGGEVLVTSTTRDLVAGSGIDFEGRGKPGLKGIPRPWRLYAAVC
jgi:class 3 adenylate cyclase